jgi:ketosteroid isomerase-like protein
MKLVSAVFVGLLLVVGNADAQTPSADEKAIRDLIAASDSGQRLDTTADSIFWTGALKRPAVGEEKRDLNPGVAERQGGTVKTKVRRIDVSRSGDMAYEFSDADITVVEKSGQTIAFTASLLRVWKKAEGQWQVAAHFQRRHDK